MVLGGLQRTIMISAVGIVLVACSEPLEPPTPPLLVNVSGRGGWWEGGCPPRDSADPSQEALSPELTARLAQQFPAGSDAALLERALRSQGFRIRGRPCPTAPAIRLAEFRQRGGGFSGPYPIFAHVAWEQDDGGRLVWAKGHVQFTGP